jgi:hypothetical protein
MIETKEYILCAAVWVQDEKEYMHQPKNIINGFVVCGQRHHNCFTTIQILNVEKVFNSDKRVKYTITQGFLTNKNRFIDRKEAAIIAFENGQILESVKLLMSEHLY